jgi:hypothetical protein
MIYKRSCKKRRSYKKRAVTKKMNKIQKYQLGGSSGDVVSVTSKTKQFLDEVNEQLLDEQLSKNKAITLLNEMTIEDTYKLQKELYKMIDNKEDHRKYDYIFDNYFVQIERNFDILENGLKNDGIIDIENYNLRYGLLPISKINMNLRQITIFSKPKTIRLNDTIEYKEFNSDIIKTYEIYKNEIKNNAIILINIDKVGINKIHKIHKLINYLITHVKYKISYWISPRHVHILVEQPSPDTSLDTILKEIQTKELEKLEKLEKLEESDETDE